MPIFLVVSAAVRTVGLVFVSLGLGGAALYVWVWFGALVPIATLIWAGFVAKKLAGLWPLGSDEPSDAVWAWRGALFFMAIGLLVLGGLLTFQLWKTIACSPGQYECPF
jgi:hypothetical protein